MCYDWTDEDSVFDIMSEGKDELYDEEELFPEMVPFNEDFHINELGDDYDTFITPLDFSLSVFFGLFQILFFSFLWDLYISSFFNASYFLFIIKNLYFFLTFDFFFEFFAYIDFFKRYNIIVFLFFFLPTFLIFFYLYFSTKLYRYLAGIIEFFYDVAESFWFKYIFKIFSTKITSLFSVFIYSFSVVDFKEKYFLLPYRNIYMSYLEPKSFVLLYFKWLPRFFILVVILCLSFLFSEFVIQTFCSLIFFCSLKLLVLKTFVIFIILWLNFFLSLLKTFIIFYIYIYLYIYKIFRFLIFSSILNYYFFFFFHI
jgi:hypothetical protein